MVAKLVVVDSDLDGDVEIVFTVELDDEDSVVVVVGELVGVIPVDDELDVVEDVELEV